MYHLFILIVEIYHCLSVKSIKCCTSVIVHHCPSFESNQIMLIISAIILWVVRSVRLQCVSYNNLHYHNQLRSPFLPLTPRIPMMVAYVGLDVVLWIRSSHAAQLAKFVSNVLLLIRRYCTLCCHVGAVLHDMFSLVQCCQELSNAYNIILAVSLPKYFVLYNTYSESNVYLWLSSIGKTSLRYKRSCSEHCLCN